MVRSEKKKRKILTCTTCWCGPHRRGRRYRRAAMKRLKLAASTICTSMYWNSRYITDYFRMILLNIIDNFAWIFSLFFSCQESNIASIFITLEYRTYSPSSGAGPERIRLSFMQQLPPAWIHDGVQMPAMRFRPVHGSGVINSFVLYNNGKSLIYCCLKNNISSRLFILR